MATFNLRRRSSSRGRRRSQGRRRRFPGLGQGEQGGQGAEGQRTRSRRRGASAFRLDQDGEDRVRGGPGVTVRPGAGEGTGAKPRETPPGQYEPTPFAIPPTPRGEPFPDVFADRLAAEPRATLQEGRGSDSVLGQEMSTIEEWAQEAWGIGAAEALELAGITGGEQLTTAFGGAFASSPGRLSGFVQEALGASSELQWTAPLIDPDLESLGALLDAQGLERTPQNYNNAVGPLYRVVVESKDPEGVKQATRELTLDIGALDIWRIPSAGYDATYEALGVTPHLAKAVEEGFITPEDAEMVAGWAPGQWAQHFISTRAGEMGMSTPEYMVQVMMEDPRHAADVKSMIQADWLENAEAYDYNPWASMAALKTYLPFAEQQSGISGTGGTGGGEGGLSEMLLDFLETLNLGGGGAEDFADNWVSASGRYEAQPGEAVT